MLRQSFQGIPVSPLVSLIAQAAITEPVLKTLPPGAWSFSDLTPQPPHFLPLLRFQKMPTDVEDTAGTGADRPRRRSKGRMGEMLEQPGVQGIPFRLVPRLQEADGRVFHLHGRGRLCFLGTFGAVLPPLLQIDGTDRLRLSLRLLVGVLAGDKRKGVYARLPLCADAKDLRCAIFNAGSTSDASKKASRSERRYRIMPPTLR